MGTLFISHSSKDNARAVFVRDWLREAGWADVFLDLDPVAGLAPGQRWQEELRKAGERCAAVVVLVSPNWLASDWCRTEFLLAAQLGKLIFPVIISPVAFDALPLELKAHYQMVDLSDPAIEAEGLEGFRIGLQRAGLHPEDFPWPPPGDPMRSPYRGLGALEQCDAAVFFGREAPITKGLDAIRQMADGTPERVLVILGASGSGKSSFLQAGLLARLARDTARFCILPTVRPGRAAMHGPKGLLASLGLPGIDGRDALRARLAGIRRAVRSGSHVDEARPLTLVMPVDQADELLDGSAESATAMACLNNLLAIDLHVLVVLTLRTDRFADLQLDGALGALARRTFDLPPLPAGAYKQIVEAPGALADPPIEIEPALTERLLNDLGARDALPLLAFTLDWMLKLGGRQLTLEDYERELGGLAGAIERAVGAALSEAVRDPALPDSHGELESLIRQLFLPWLVQVDEAGGLPQRRVAMVDELPASARPLMTPLVAHRLLITRDDGGRATVEVAHEAVLRHWPALARWIEEDRGRLAALRAVQRAAQDWSRRASDEDASQWLVHRGERLTDAEQLRSDRNLGALLDEADLAYLSVCRAEEDRRAAEQVEQAARERAHLARQRQQQRRISIALGLIGVLVAAFGVLAVTQLRSASEQVSLVLADYSRRALSDGDTARAMRLGLLAAREDWLTVPAPTARPSLAATAQASRLVRDLAGHNSRVRSALFNADETRMATVDDDGEVRLWDIGQGRALGVIKHGGRNPTETGASFSPDGRQLVSWGHDGSLVVRDAADGREVARQQRPTSVWEVSVSSQADRIVARESRTVALLRLSDGQVMSQWNAEDTVRMALLDDQQRFLAWDRGGNLSLRRLVDGQVVMSIRLPGGINDAGMLADDAQVLVMGRQGELSLRDARGGEVLAVLDAPVHASSRLVFSPDRRRAVLWWPGATELPVWDADAPDALTTLRMPRQVYQLRWSHDARKLLTWSGFDAPLDLWDVATGERVGGQHHDGGVNGAVFSSDDERVLSWGRDGVARVWDVANSEELSRFKHDRPVWDALFSQDGTRVFSWDASGVIEVWGARRRGSSGRVISMPQARMHVGENQVTGAAGPMTRHGQGASIRGFHEIPGASRGVSWGYGGRVRLWDTASRTTIWTLPPRHGATRFHTASRQLLLWTPEAHLQAWDRVRRAPVSAPHEVTRVLDVADTGDALTVLVLTAEREARVWRTADDTLGPPVSLPETPQHGWLTIAGARFLAEARGEVTSTYSVFDEAGVRRASVVMDAPVQFEYAGISPDGRRLILTSLAGEVKVVDLETGITRFHHRPTQRSWSLAAMSDDGRHVVVADATDTRMWSMAADTSSPQWIASDGGLSRAQFIDQSDAVLLVYRNGRVTLRQIGDGTVLANFSVASSLSDAVVSSSGQQVLIWDRDGFGPGNLSLRDMRSGAEIGRALQADSVEGVVLKEDEGAVWYLDGSRSSVRSADVAAALASDDPDLASRVCGERLAGSDGPAPAIRRITDADVAFAPILAGRVGEDVCD